MICKGTIEIRHRFARSNSEVSEQTIKALDRSNVALPDTVLRVFIVFRWQTNDLTLSLSEAKRRRLRAVDIREAVILS